MVTVWTTEDLGGAGIGQSFATLAEALEHQRLFGGFLEASGGPFLLNAFPMGLVPPEGIQVSFTPVKPEEIPADFESAIGHADTANVISGLLGRSCPCVRITVPPVKEGETFFVAAYQGPRLPEGSTTLPEGASISFYRVECHPVNVIDRMWKLMGG